MLRFVKSKNKKIFIVFIAALLFLSFINISTTAYGEDRPDLIIESIELPDQLVEGKNLEFIVNIENQGTENVSVGVELGLSLKIDGDPVDENSTFGGLLEDKSILINLSWTPGLSDIGTHLLSIEVDPDELILESDENNNVWDAYIEVAERNTDLEIIDIVPMGDLVVNQTIAVYSTIKNYGRDSVEPIYAQLNSSEDGKVEVLMIQGSLHRGDTFIFMFNWTPSRLGTQTISVDLKYGFKTHDFEELSIVVGIDQPEWWDENWHYRYFLIAEGNGNISLSFNFTELLSDLDIFSETFEPDTIRIIEYNRYGEVTDEIEDYKFEEITGFNPVTDATGTLIWNVTGSSNEKYYCIYFDVSSNGGDRSGLTENEGIAEAGGITTGIFEFVEGWWAEILDPINEGYALIFSTIDITVSTSAKAENVTAFVFFNDDESHNFTFYLNDIDDAVIWESEDFSLDEEGDWTLIVTCRDWTDYATVVEHALYVGKPDVGITGISFSTDWSATSPTIYKNDTVNITAKLVVHNATVEDVEVSIEIFDIDDMIVFTQTVQTTIFKDKNNSVSFSWFADETGGYNVTIMVDPNDLIDEEDETNNDILEEITVLDWPDLAIQDIILPLDEIMEFEEVKIDVDIVNIGEGDAENYEVRLYIENVAQGVMTYTHEMDNKFFSLENDTGKIVSLYWDYAVAGEWLVGAKIIVDDTKRDTNKENNRLFLSEILKIKSYEKNKPVIKNVSAEPYVQEQGGSVKITANITDDTGLDSVKIIIKNPLGYTYGESIMLRTTEDKFQYIYTNTPWVGKYTFEIIATDLSVHSNVASKFGNFTVYEDETNPVINYFEAYPQVQLVGKSVEIICIATDNVRIDSVSAFITYPGNVSYKKTLSYSSSGKYVFNDVYDIAGRYTFYIKVADEAGNFVATKDYSFWITENLDDTDNDGMSDEWEERYSFDPEDPNDAKDDDDEDGLTNLKEYEFGTNPHKDIFGENAGARLKDNVGYLAGSIIVFLLIIVLSMYGKRRRLR